MDDLVERVRHYLSFLSAIYAQRIPHVMSGNQAADALLHAPQSLWNELRDHEETKALASVMLGAPRIIRLYEDFISQRQHLNRTLEEYVNDIALELALKLLRRTPALNATRELDSLTNDFLTFVNDRELTFVQMTPLFNFAMRPRELALDSSTRITEIESDEISRVVEAFSNPAIIFIMPTMSPS